MQTLPQITAGPVPPGRWSKWALRGAFGTLGVLVLVVGALLVFNWKSSAKSPPGRAPEPPPKLVRHGETLTVPAALVRTLNLTVAPVEPAKQSRRLPALPGTLGLDNNRLARARARFAGEVVAFGTEEGNEIGIGVAASESERPLQVGDPVEKNQLLAVVWSKDLGEKKSELVDAVSQLQLNRVNLERLRGLLGQGFVPERSVREAERAEEQARIARDRAVRTLEVWRIEPDEIKALIAEGEKILSTPDLIAKGKLTAHPEWARVEVRAPLKGTLLEKNTNLHDMVDPTVDLFKVADLSQLTVYASAFEDDLPLLRGLKRPVKWQVRLPLQGNGPPAEGVMLSIRDILDPVQRTALVTGQVKNVRDSAGNYTLKAGMYVTATIELPPPEDEVQISGAALVDDGREAIVFVQPDPAKPDYVRVRVPVSRRFDDVVYLLAKPPAGGAPAGVTYLKVGDRVVTNGAVLLNEALGQLLNEAK